MALALVASLAAAAADDLERGARVFARSCAACHGRTGRGDGPASRHLDPPPRDLTSRHFRFRSTASGELPRPEDLARTIRQGLPGSAMPAFGTLLDDGEIAELVAFLGSLRPEAEPPAEALLIGPAPTADARSRADGEALYLLTGCWRCHGVDGSGRGPSAKTLTDSDGRPLQATDFRHDPFKGGRTIVDVMRALRTGLNGTPMPSYDEALLVAREDAGDLPGLDHRLPARAQENVARFLAASPTRSELGAMSDGERAELRDRRLFALAHHVLTLGRRRGPGYWLLHQEPEREPRRP